MATVAGKLTSKASVTRISEKQAVAVSPQPS